MIYIEVGNDHDDCIEGKLTDDIIVYLDEDSPTSRGNPIIVVDDKEYKRCNSIPIDISYDQSSPLSPQYISLDESDEGDKSSLDDSLKIKVDVEEWEEQKEDHRYCQVDDLSQDTSSKINPELFAILYEMGYDEERIHHVLKRCNSISSAVQMLNPDYQSPSETYRTQCPICFDDYPVSEMITLECLHRLCRTCFSSYCETKIKENEVLSDQLCCPFLIPGNTSSAPSKMCSHPITVHEIKGNISKEIYEKYERFITKSFCLNEKLTSCPKCNEWYVDLQEVLHLEHTWNSIQCGHCQHKFCGKCGQVPHKAQYDQDIDCDAYAKWLEANSQTDDNFSKYIQKNKLFACPKCGMYGALESGCKFMYCRCKENYCALCGQKLSQSEHFSHFSGVPGATGPFGNKCLGMKENEETEKEKKKKEQQTVHDGGFNPLVHGMAPPPLVPKKGRGRQAAKPPPAVLPPPLAAPVVVPAVGPVADLPIVLDNYPNTRRRKREMVRTIRENEEGEEVVEIKQEGVPQRKKKLRKSKR